MLHHSATSHPPILVAESEPIQPTIDFPGTYFKGECFQRSFQISWYTLFPWITYTVKDDSVYCYACCRFKVITDERSKGVFIDKGFRNWRKALERLKLHQDTDGHKTCMVMWVQQRKMQARQSSVAKQISSHHQRVVEGNRLYLKYINETLVFCAKQNMSLRGHLESRSKVNEQSNDNRGNFLELLSLRCADNSWLEQRFASQNASSEGMWTSPEIQNEILQLVGKQCLKRICEEARNSQYFGVIMDETSDISRSEQVAIVLRYCVNGVTKERFIGFHAVSDTTGESLYYLLKSVLETCGLDVTKLVGQAFDGAANMSGQFKGVAARMKEIAPAALYVHCHGHLLNLALQSAISFIPLFRNCLGTLQSLYVFIEGSTKRHALFQEIQKQQGYVFISLKDQSDTRWSCRYTSVKATVCRLKSITQALIEMERDRNCKVSNDATSLLKSLCAHDMVLCLLILETLLAHTNALSAYLQGKNVDIVTAKKTAEAVVKTLRKLRNPDDFAAVWEKSLGIVREMKEVLSNTPYDIAKPTVPRQKRLPRRFDNGSKDVPEYESPEFYYRSALYYASLDQITGQIEERFTNNNHDILCALSSIVCNFESATENDAAEKLAQFYGIDEAILTAERKIFLECRTEETGESSINILKWLAENKLDTVLPVFNQVVTVLSAIPVTSCSAERSFSALRRLKSYMRASMGQQRLTSLALCNIERDIANEVMHNDIGTLIDEFSKRVPSRSLHFF